VVRSALLLGFGPGAALGIGRFAYALMLPAMQASLELSYSQTGYLGSANTFGYLFGALISHRALAVVGYRRGFCISLLVQTLALALLTLAPGFEMLLALRFLQGIFGAFVFVGGAALLLASGGRGPGLGLYFGGVGLGIVLSPLVLPLSESWRFGWLLLAGLSFLMSAVSVRALPGLLEPAAPLAGRGTSLRPVVGLLVAYALYGAGYIGYMTFVTTAAVGRIVPFWMVLGLGSLLTGMIWGRMIERLGAAQSLRTILLILAISSLYPLVTTVPYVSAFLFGMSFLGVITAVSDSFRTLLPADAWARAMALSTAAFALGQAVGPGISGIFGDMVGDARGALGIATVLLGCSLAVAWLFLRTVPRESPVADRVG
jgi:predicted MFS family arabinose efflux permease